VIYKKFLIVFLIFFILFGFTNVFAAEIPTTNVSSDLSNYVNRDLKFFRYALNENDIFNMDDYKKFIKDLGLNANGCSYYFCVYPLGYMYGSETQPISQMTNRYYFIYFTSNTTFPSDNVGSGKWYNVDTNYKSVYCSGALRININTCAISSIATPTTVVIPDCWQWYHISSFFEYDPVTSSIDDIHRDLTVDTSKQKDINLTTHNGEMNDAGDTVKNSNLYTKFSNLSNDLQEAFTYDDNSVTTLPVSFNKKNVVLKSNEISTFFRDNNLGFVITLWQSILWFSLFYTMFIFIRKIYRSVVGGNPTDDVSKTLSNEDNKIVGGF